MSLPLPRRALAPALALALLQLTHQAPPAHAGDWANWRGPHNNSTSDESGLVEKWSPRGGPGSNLLWKKAELGSRSTPIVLGGKLYVLARDLPGTELEGEKVVCADAATGEVLWEHRFNVYLTDVPDTRVAWSSVVADPETGRVYAQGVCGYFCCLEGDTGRLVWERSLAEEIGLISTYGGRTNFPILYEDTVLISAVVVGWGDEPKWGLLAKPAHRFLAFDKATGELRWLSGTSLAPYDTTYSTPALGVLGGQPAAVFGSGDGAVWAMQPGTGRMLWKCELSRRGLNVSPVIDERGFVYTGHSEENLVGSTMGAVVAIDGNKFSGLETTDLTGKEAWKQYQAMVGKSSPLVIDGRVYAVNDSAKLLVFDAQTGKEIDRIALGRVMRGTPLYADGKIYIATASGRCWVLKPTPDGVEVVHKLDLRDEEVDASPIVSNGRVYLTTGSAMYCLGDAGAANTPVPTPSAPRAEPEDRRVAQAQLVPWDSLVAPGGRQLFRVRLYNAGGQFLREADPADVDFGVGGPGAIDGDGAYTAPANSGHDAALVLCEVEGVKAQARVRIVPPLPWSFDFEDGGPAPVSWVGGRIRYVPRKNEAGEHYLAKPTELPTRPGAPTTKLGTRSQMSMGPSDLSNYTIQADIQLTQALGGESSAPMPEIASTTPASAVKMPSAGVVNSRYSLAIFGDNDELRLYSWFSHDKRTQRTIPRKFEPGVWYRLKLTVVPDETKNVALVRGKVWLVGETEPDAWTLEMEDRRPNLRGAPGLFGDSKDAEFYVDNLIVTPN